MYLICSWGYSVPQKSVPQIDLVLCSSRYLCHVGTETFSLLGNLFHLFAMCGHQKEQSSGCFSDVWWRNGGGGGARLHRGSLFLGTPAIRPKNWKICGLQFANLGFRGYGGIKLVNLLFILILNFDLIKRSNKGCLFWKALSKWKTYLLLQDRPNYLFYLLFIYTLFYIDIYNKKA